MRRILAALAPIAIMASAVPVGAHTNIEVNGRVAALSPTLISVVTPSGTLDITLNEATQVLRSGDNRPATIKNVKVGQLVTVIGYGDTADDMLALGIIIKKGG